MCLARQADSNDDILDILDTVWWRPDRCEAMLAWFYSPEKEENPVAHCRARQIAIRGAGAFPLDDELPNFSSHAVPIIHGDDKPDFVLGQDINCG